MSGGVYWRRKRGSTWHVCYDNPRHNAFSLEPDIYTMASLCGTQDFQRDDFSMIPWTRKGAPKRVCKGCLKEALGAIAVDDGDRGRTNDVAKTPASEES